MVTPIDVKGPALASIETSTIARGVVVLDQMVKRAEVIVHAATTLSPGRYLILVGGTEASIEEAVDAAREAVAEDRVDGVTLWAPHPQLLDSLALRGAPGLEEALALVETSTISSGLLAADRCLKELDSNILELRLGSGLSGKAVFTLTGPLHMLDEVSDLVQSLIGERVVRIERIAQPHPDLPRHLLGAEPAEPRRRG